MHYTSLNSHLLNGFTEPWSLRIHCENLPQSPTVRKLAPKTTPTELRENIYP